MGDITTRLVLQEDASRRLSSISSAARSAATQLRQVGQQIDNAFRTNAPTQFASRLGSAVNQTSAQVGSLGEAIDRAMGELDGSSISTISSSFSEAASGARDLSGAVEEVGSGIDDLADSAEELGENLDDVGGDELGDVADDAGEAGREIESASGKASKFKAALAGIAAAVSLTAIGHQIGGFISDSVKIGQQFSSTMSEVQAISGASGEELKQLTDTAREYGATTIFSASQAGEALKYMALAGWDANQSTSALGGVLNLAAASGMELGTASDMVTDYLSAFGMAADQAGYFADLLTYAQSHSNTSTMQLGQAFLNSAAMLHSAGQDVETTTSLLEAMANQGTKGSVAGTQLAAIMRDITNKMENGSIKIGDTSVAVADAKGNFRDLTDILTDVEGAVDGLGTSERAVALASTFTADSTRGLNQILTEGMDKVAGYEEALRRSSGTASVAADVMTDNLEGDLANMNSAFEEMQIQVYEGMESPLRNVVQAVTKDFLPALTEFLPAAIGGVATTVGKFADAMTPLITTILKNPQAVGDAFKTIGAGILAFKGAGLVTDIASAVTGVGQLHGVFGKLASVITANPWGAAAAAIAGGVVAVKAAVDKYNEIQIDSNLEEHFGQISLDENQVSDLAGQIVPVGITAQLSVANVQFEQAEELISQGEAALEENNYLVWKVASVGLELTDAESETLIANGQTFVDSLKQAFQQQEYGSEEIVKTLLGDQSGPVLETMQGWFEVDSTQLTELGDAVTSLLEDSVNGGIEGVEIDSASLSGKINEILSDALSAQPDGGAEGAGAESSALADSITSMLTQAFNDGAGEVDTDALQTQISGMLQESLNIPEEEASGLAESITNTFQNSIDTGVSSINTAAALQILQQKMLDLVSGAKLASLKGQLDMLSFTSSGAALDPESWAAVIEQAGGYQKELLSAEEQSYAYLMGQIENSVSNDESRRAEANSIIEMLGGAYDQLRASSSLGIAEFANKSMQDAYGSDIDQIIGSINGNETLQNVINPNSSNFSLSAALAEYQNALKKSGVDKSTRRAIADRYEQMVPTVQEMQKAIDEANEAGRAVPQALMDAYNQAIEIGAAGGDENVGWEYLAQQMVQGFSDKNSLVSALEEKGLNLSDFPEALREGVNRAFTETADIDYSEMTKSLTAAFSGSEVDWSVVESILNQYGFSISEALKEQGIDLEAEEVPVNAGNITPDISDLAKNLEGLEATGGTVTLDGGEIAVEYEVVAGQTMSEIAEEAGITLQELIDANPQIENPDYIEIGQKINIPASAVQVDSSGVGEAVRESTTEAAEEAGATETPVETPANVTLTAGEVDASGARTAAQTEADNTFKDPLETPGQADITLSQENNSDEVYSMVGQDLITAFNTPFSIAATAHVNVTMDYSIANPSSTVTVGGAGSGTGTLTATIAGHAEGGYFDSPHLAMVAEGGYGEWIIPNDGSEDSKTMALDAMQSLGMTGNQEATVAPISIPTGQDEAAAPSTGGTKTVNVNVNGSGNIEVSGGASKEQVLEVMLEHLRDIFMDIIQQEIIEEGDGVYEY